MCKDLGASRLMSGLADGRVPQGWNGFARDVADALKPFGPFKLNS